MRAFVINFLASGFGKISGSFVRIIEVPLLLAALGAEEYGRWLLLSSIPAWLTIANLGLGSVASNEMSMRVAEGDIQSAKSVYSSALAFLFKLSAAVFVLALLAVISIPWHRVLDASLSRQGEFTVAAILLTFSVLLSFFVGVFSGRFLAAGKAHVAITFASFIPWVNLTLIAIVLSQTRRFDWIASALLCSNIFFAAFMMCVGRLCMPEITFCRSSIDSRWRSILMRKGLAFQAFPLGNAVLFQGNLFIVQAFLGPAGVAAFATARTLVRSANQAMEMVNQSVWPELSLAIGGGNLGKAMNLHRVSVAISVVLSFPMVMLLMLWGPELYGVWTRSTISMSHSLIFCFLLPIPFNALWFTSSVVHMASNRHEGLAIRYLLATLFSSAMCIMLTKMYGIYGAALSTLIVDICVIPYVFRKSLQLTGDTFLEFVASIPRIFAGASRSLVARTCVRDFNGRLSRSNQNVD